MGCIVAAPSVCSTVRNLFITEFWFLVYGPRLGLCVTGDDLDQVTTLNRTRRFITVYYTILRMPIGIDRFESEPAETLSLREGSQPMQVLQFLVRNPEKAFTQTEIHDATDINRGSVGAVLSRLEDRGLVRHKGTYWAIGEDERLASLAAQRRSRTALNDEVQDDAYATTEAWDADLPDLGERQ